jgi:ferredoxin
MPPKYHIHTAAAAPRVRPVGKLGIVDWREDCSSCHNCVKRACIYGFYRDEYDTLRGSSGYLDYIYQCKGCLNCVQSCTKGILTRVINPEYRQIGDEYYTADILLSTWYQAETGRIPVSGAGYGGPFSGPGFDAMWTDMSEIVRPTRDGIHGREYISTSVDIGRKLAHLRFVDGRLAESPPPLLECPLPILFDVVPQRWRRGPIVAAVAKAAAEIGSYSVIRSGEIPAGISIDQHNVIPWLHGGEQPQGGVDAAAMVMIDDSDDVAALQAAIKRENPEQIVAIRVPAAPGCAARIVELVRGGAEVLHLVFDAHGREQVPNADGESPSPPAPLPQRGEGSAEQPRHARDVIREVHRALVRDGTRDLATLVASGGIAQPEHVTKAILCGADLVAVDIPLAVALECRLCGECDRHEICPVDMDGLDPAYAVRRIVNLLGAWHQQLIEMMGAMGVREVRRLRGEAGRSMFFEDLERDTFGRLFGKPEQSQGVA